MHNGSASDRRILCRAGPSAYVDVEGKVAVVTGPTSGIGTEIARDLVRRGALVVLAARDRGKADVTIADIGGTTEFVPLDLASLASVREAAREIRTRHPAIQLLVNNAGIHTSRFKLTEDGFEETFQVNHLGHFLLTRELLPALTAAAPSRVVNVASDAHRGARGLDLSLAREPRGWNGTYAYAHSKLCNILFTRELARRLAGTGVSAYAAHPGVVRTRWARGSESGIFRFGVALASPFMLSPEKGARSPLAACLKDGLPDGAYLVRGSVVQPTRAARDDEAARTLWEESERMVGGA